MGRAAAFGAALLLASVASGCGTAGPSAGTPSRPLTSAPVEADPCARAHAAEKFGGPVNWTPTGSMNLANTYAFSHAGVDQGVTQLTTKQPVVLDSVTLLGADPTYFAPVKVVSAWLSPDTGALTTVKAGRWPAPLRPLACQQLSPSTTKILVLRLQPTIGAAAHGRAWAAHHAILLHYHALDGTPYVAPYGYGDVFPTRPGSDLSKGLDLLDSDNRSSAPSPSPAA